MVIVRNRKIRNDTDKHIFAQILLYLLREWHSNS